MFTGIVQGTATVSAIRHDGASRRLRVALPSGLSAGVARGASVAVAGVCLTVVGQQGDELEFDVVRETLERTTLSAAVAGRRLNVERAVRVGDEVGGHAVAGHVWGTAEVVARTVQGDLTLRFDPGGLAYVFEKGFVALDGVSLTVGAVDRAAGTFDVHLIPETLRVTTLGDLRPGDRVNVELDPITVAVVETTRAIYRPE
jgi:riboflavin synthase